MSKEKINNWLQRLIDAKTTVITLLGITTNETVLDVFWNEWSDLERKLRDYKVETFGKPISEIKKLIIPILLIFFFSSCQTQQREQREQSITQVENQTAIEAIHNAEKDRVGRETAELLRILRGVHTGKQNRPKIQANRT